jgi:hypothetical protein
MEGEVCSGATNTPEEPEEPEEPPIVLKPQRNERSISNYVLVDGLSVSSAQTFEVDANQRKFGDVLSGIANILTLHPDDVVYVNHEDIGSRRRLLNNRLKFSYQIDVERTSEGSLMDSMGTPNYRAAMLQLFVNVSGVPDLGLTVGPINVTDYINLEEGENSLEEVSSPGDATALIVVVTILSVCCIGGLALGFMYKETCANTIEAGRQKIKASRERRREANRSQPSVWTVKAPILNVRNAPSINGEQIATKHAGEQIQIIEERPTNLYPNAKWLRLAHPIRGHRESWVISNVDEMVLLVKQEEELVGNSIKGKESLVGDMISNPMLTQPNQSNAQRKIRSTSPPSNTNRPRTNSQPNNINRARKTTPQKDTTSDIRKSRAASVQRKTVKVDEKKYAEEAVSARQIQVPIEPEVKPVSQMDFSIPRMRKPKRRPSSIKKK